MSSVPREVHDLILARDNFSCLACARGVGSDRGWDYSIQHRIPAGSGGSTHPFVTSLANLITLCGSGTTGCHGRVERERLEAQHYGFAIRGRRHDPAMEPVWIADPPDEDNLSWGEEWPAPGRRWYLTPDGGKSLDEPGAEPRPEEPPAPVSRKDLPAHFKTLSPAEAHQFRAVYGETLRRSADISERIAAVDELDAAAAAALGGAA